MREDEARPHSAEEAALIISCLRGLPLDPSQTPDWHALLQMASAHGVLGIIYRSLLEASSEIPGFFSTAAQRGVNEAERLAVELESLLHEFAEQSIDVLPLKGPALAESLYGAATMRSCVDLDLLVRSQDYPRAEALLTDLGFAACSRTDDYHCRFIRQGIPVELHFGVASPRYFPFDLDGVWARARTVKFRSSPSHLMSGDDLILFLCLHGLKHGFSRLIWILDVAKALQKLQEDGYANLALQAQGQGAEPWLLIGCEVVREMLPQQLPAKMDAVIAATGQSAVRARRIASELFADGLSVVNDHIIRSFYLQTERSARRRWRCRLSYFAPTVEDYRWAERHRIYRGLAPVLRPCRLLQKYGPSTVWRILFPPT